MRRGSFFSLAASSRARGVGRMVERLTVRPSDLEIIFWATTRMSSSRKIILADFAARVISRLRLEFFRISGMPGMGISSIDAIGEALAIFWRERERDFVMGVG